MVSPSALLWDDSAAAPFEQAGLAWFNATSQAPASSNLAPRMISYTKRAGSTSVVYTLTFSEPIAGLSANSFELLQTPGSMGAHIESISAPVSGNMVYEVTVNKGGGDGTFTLKLTGDQIHDYGGLGLVSGAFEPSVNYAVGIYPTSVRIADVNGDGHPDIVTGNLNIPTGPPTVSVLLGNGDGTFQPRTDYPQGTFATGPDFVTTLSVDVNLDGLPDQISIRNQLTNSSPPVISIMSVELATSAGKFLPEVTYLASGNRWAESVAVGDLNDDGRPDVVTANRTNSYLGVPESDGTVSVFLAEVPQPPITTFNAPDLLRGFFGASDAAGSWTSDNLFPRRVGDFNADGRADIVGFSGNGVLVTLTGAEASYSAGYTSFGSSTRAGGWTTDDRFPRQVADVTGDGRADIVGFGGNGVFVSVTTADNNVGGVQLGLNSFGFLPGAGGWTSNDKYPRCLADVNGDGTADIVGFGGNGVFVALAHGDGTFGSPFLASRSFAASNASGGWTSNDRYPRRLADVNGDGRADIVGFGNAGVFIAYGKASGMFSSFSFAKGSFGASAQAGGWTSDTLTPRFVADVNGDGFADIGGFGPSGIYLAAGHGNGTFGYTAFDTAHLGAGQTAGGWTSNNLFPRLLADATGDGRADIFAFGNAGVYLAPSQNYLTLA